MKSSTKILIGAIVVLCFALGFLIGLFIDYPKTDSSKLGGTIGKMNNYRNVKVSEKDIKLRSDLLANEQFLKSYRHYYSFNYSASVKLCDDIDFAIQAAENVTLFREDYSMEIENVKQYRQILEQSRLDILLAITSLQKLSEIDDYNMTQIINNANIAIAQIKFKENCLLAFVESIEKFIRGNNPNQFSDLIKAHDLFALNQLVMAVMTNNKPMIKAYNNLKVFSSNEELKLFCSDDQLKNTLQNDFKTLQFDLKNNNQLNAIGITSQIGAVQEQFNVLIPAFENLGDIICSQCLGVICVGSQNLGILLGTEKLGIILNTEKLSIYMDSEIIGSIRSNTLGFLDFERLGAANAETLGILPIEIPDP